MTDDEAQHDRDYRALEERLMAFDWSYADSYDKDVFDASILEQHNLFHWAVQIGPDAVKLYFDVVKAHS